MPDVSERGEKKKHRGKESVTSQNKSLTAGEKKKSGRFVGVAETSGELAKWCRLKQKNVN